MSVRKPHLPLLIDAFPVPPSHIPPTPSATAVSFNPPPSRPPSSPLPPVPGPSKLTDADTLQLLLLSSRANRSRRSSKYSVGTGENNRDSLISTASAHSYGAVSPSPRPSPRLPPPSNRSSTASSGSMPTSPRAHSRPSIAFSIDEEREEVKARPMPRNVVSPLPLFDEDDVDQSPRRRGRRHQANESISSIDMRDILGATSGGEDDDVLGSKPNLSRLASSHSHKSSLAYLNPELEPFQPTTSHSRTPSMSSKHSATISDLASSSTITLRPTVVPTTPTKPSREAAAAKASSPPPRRPPPISTAREVRSPSPDIDTIIQATPRPAKLSVARSFSLTHEKRKQLNSVRSVKSMRSMRGGGGAVDEFGALSSPMRFSKTTIGLKKKSAALDTDESLDYIVNGVWNQSQGEDEEEEKRVRQLEKVLDGSGSDSDDSSLDLHTPLPHLMVRDGLLSPNSKLLPGAQSRSTTPHVAADGRPGSTMSNFSSVSKSGVMKDERDTPSRRVRHRDGRLLRGGIGLTTGLGWSDSEDEDAPSPLTKRLSTLNLSARSSISSLSSRPSQAPHPLSRSYSSGTLYDTFEDDEGKDGFQANEWGQRSTSNPPTAWSRKMSTHSASTRTSMASSGGRLSIASSNGRMSVASTGSAFSLEVAIPEGYVSSTDSHNRRSADGLRTPSSGSTLSIPMPVTPQHEPQAPLETVKSEG
ncbi:hypothetical protein MD484_g8366, partial [Candolleomyces efflorescens]